MSENTRKQSTLLNSMMASCSCIAVYDSVLNNFEYVYFVSKEQVLDEGDFLHNFFCADQ